MGCGNSQEVKPTDQDTDNPNVLLKQNNGIFKVDYMVKQEVGQGTYGVVKRCKHRQSGEERVVKIIHKSSMKKEELQKKMANDVIFLRKIDHPNVIKTFEFYQDDEYFYIVTEYVTGGDLIRRLEYKGLLSEKEASSIVKQILSVLVWCHTHGIMHRDLKPENIMIETNSGKEENYQIKVIDWGTAIQFNSQSKIKELIGTPYYIAPEVVMKNYNYNEKVDLWSLGAMLYTILSGDPPFYAEDIYIILQLVEQGEWNFKSEIWDHEQGGISQSAKDLISKLMTKDPEKRISAEEALKHEWIQNAPSTEIKEELKQKYSDKLRKFNANNVLQQAAILFISQQCQQKAERDKLTQAFRSIDKDGSGTLCKEEILNFFTETMSPEQAEEETEKMIKKVDIDNNGLINYSEFLMATSELENEKLKDNLKEAFQYFDMDKNGYITTEELKKIINMKENDQNLWDNILSQADKDNDGQISFDEFCKMMQHMAEGNNNI